MRHIKESTGKKVKAVWTRHEKGWRRRGKEWWGWMWRGGEGKGRLKLRWMDRRGGANAGCVEVSGEKHWAHIEVGNRRRSCYAIIRVSHVQMWASSVHVALVFNEPERLTSNCWSCVATLSRLWQEGRCDGWNTANTWQQTHDSKHVTWQMYQTRVRPWLHKATVSRWG